MIRDKGDYIELDVVVEKYKKTIISVKLNGKPMLDENGKKIKEVREKIIGFFTVPTTFLKDGLTLYNPHVNEKNQVLKTKCTVYDKYTNKFFLVNHKASELDQKLSCKSTIGFKIGQ